jgi:hypothetical protein
MPVRTTPLLEIASSDPFMSEEEKEILSKQKKAYDALLNQAGLAKYKIELLVGKDWAPSKPCPGALSFWESGSKFHGGGDTIMHICPGCEAFIPDAQHGYGYLICPKCHKLWKGEQVSGQILARLDAKGWTQAILKFLYRLELNADIRIKYHPEDIRSAAIKEQQVQQGEALDRVRRNRAVRVYPLRNIIKDTSAGATLESRILAFVKA